MDRGEPWEGRFRVRCPKDDGTSAHLAVDVRAPWRVNGPHAKLITALRRCYCGAEMVLKGADP